MSFQNSYLKSKTTPDSDMNVCNIQADRKLVLSEKCYQISDCFRTGVCIWIYSHGMFITSCDKLTKWFMSQMNYFYTFQFTAIEINEPSTFNGKFKQEISVERLFLPTTRFQSFSNVFHLQVCIMYNTRKRAMKVLACKCNVNAMPPYRSNPHWRQWLTF